MKRNICYANATVEAHRLTEASRNLSRSKPKAQAGHGLNPTQKNPTPSSSPPPPPPPHGRRRPPAAGLLPRRRLRALLPPLRPSPSSPRWYHLHLLSPCVFPSLNGWVMCCSRCCCRHRIGAARLRRRRHQACRLLPSVRRRPRPRHPAPLPGRPVSWRCHRGGVW